LLGYPWPVYALLLGLAVGPQLLSHTSFTWALKYLSAAFVAVAILGEPVGSALLAWALLSEPFAPLQLVGFVVLLAGIAVTALAERVSGEAPPLGVELRPQSSAD
jgi:drug/metabolite transporter (DMT)-like permease